jgi:hypothetical protein
LLNWISNIRHILCKWKIRNQSISPPCWNLVWRSICLHDLQINAITLKFLKKWSPMWYNYLTQKLIYAVTRRNNQFIEKHDVTNYLQEQRYEHYPIFFSNKRN